MKANCPYCKKKHPDNFPPFFGSFIALCLSCDKEFTVDVIRTVKIKKMKQRKHT